MIDKEIQKQLFDEYGTPEHVRRHCDAVADVAVKIGKALSSGGYDLDLELIEGAARVHDVARTEPKHDEVGAEYLIARGYPAEAELVRGHMKHPFSDPGKVDEQDVICLADRVVREDEYVGIEKRIEYLLAKPGITPEGSAMIRAAMAATQIYISEIEKMIGSTLDELLGPKASETETNNM